MTTPRMHNAKTGTKPKDRNPYTWDNYDRYDLDPEHFRTAALRMAECAIKFEATFEEASDAIHAIVDPIGEYTPKKTKSGIVTRWDK